MRDDNNAECDHSSTVGQKETYGLACDSIEHMCTASAFSHQICNLPIPYFGISRVYIVESGPVYGQLGG